ncbi:ester cyclase [Rhodococcus hoagii]|nr:ester cyclase [Prescottella equi]MBM9837796.1 ester cyclase [Prescottella equi]NKS39194.1 ester cyclase [Prescottella equi]
MSMLQPFPRHANSAPVRRASVRGYRGTTVATPFRGRQGTTVSTRVLSDSTCTHVVDVAAGRVDITDWLFSLPEAEYRRCCPPDHITIGVGTAEDGHPLSIGVETIGDALLIHHFATEVVEPHHCRMLSTSDVVSAEGRTTVDVTWELRAQPTGDGRCTVTDRILVTPTGDYFAFIERHGIVFEDAAASCHAACGDHVRRETPLLAGSIARRASNSNGRHAADSTAPGKLPTIPDSDGDTAKAVVRRTTEQVQGGGDFTVFDELFADDYVDHTPQPGLTPDKSGTRLLYQSMRAAFQDFHAEIHWQSVDGDLVTTYKTYRGTRRGTFPGVEPTGRAVTFDTVDVMRVRGGRIVEHWGAANLLSLMDQLG